MTRDEAEELAVTFFRQPGKDEAKKFTAYRVLQIGVPVLDRSTGRVGRFLECQVKGLFGSYRVAGFLHRAESGDVTIDYQDAESRPEFDRYESLYALPPTELLSLLMRS